MSSSRCAYGIYIFKFPESIRTDFFICCASCKWRSLQRRLSGIIEEEFVLLVCASRQDFIADHHFLSAYALVNHADSSMLSQ